MGTRAITFTKMNGFLADALLSKLIDLDSDTFSMRIITETLTVSSATNATFTEVVGSNYTAGGIIAVTTVDVGPNGELTLESVTDLLWPEDATGWPDGATAIIYDDTASRIIALADIRNAGVVVSTLIQAVDINLSDVNGSGTVDLLNIT